MDEIWERAVDAALDGQTDVASVRSLTLDGAVKCLHGRLPQPSLFEKFHSLQHLSIANIGVSSLEHFPRLQNLQRLILSDNRIAGGLEFLVEAGLESLRDLDLSNNRISDINDLRPLAELRLVSLDLYECSVTRIKDYRAQVFGLIRSLKYLDKMDVDENERPESDDEDEDEEEEDDPGSGEVDGDDHPFRLNNGDQAGIEGVVDVDEDEESDADEEESETPRVVNGLSRSSRDSPPHSNGFGVVAVDGDDDDDDDDGEEDDDLVEVYEDDEGEDEDVVEVHEIDDSEDEDGVEYDEDEDEDEDGEDEANNDERDFGEVGGTGRSTCMEGEIDGHEQGEVDVDEDDNGETGEEEQAVEEDGDFDDEDEEEDYDNGYLVQPVERAEPRTAGSDVDPGDEDEDPEIEEDLEEDEEEDLDGEIQELPSSSSHKRKRNEDSHDDGDDCEDEDEDDDDDMMPYSKSSKHH